MASKIRVLLASGSLSGGGSERQTVEILNYLDRDRFEPTLYLISRTGEFLPEVPADVPIFAYSDLKLKPRLNWPGRLHRAEVRHLSQVLSRERIDVVYDRTFHMTLVTAPASRRARVRRVSVVVSNPQLDFERTARRFMWFKRRLLRRAYLDADRVLAVSDGVARAVVDYHRLSSNQVVTARNFVDLERIDRLAAEPLPADSVASGRRTRERRNVEDAASILSDAGGDGHDGSSFSVPESDTKNGARFQIVAAGRLSPEKGVRELIEAVKFATRDHGCTALSLSLLGTGPQEAALKQLVERYRLTDRIHFKGFQPNPYAFLAAADLYCLPSLYEGMPNVLIEAMACRTPVLATDCESGPREILANGKFGRLVPPGDPKSLAAAIADAMKNPNGWQGLVPAARTRVEKEFSLMAGIRRVEDILANVFHRK